MVMATQHIVSGMVLVRLRLVVVSVVIRDGGEIAKRQVIVLGRRAGSMLDAIYRARKTAGGEYQCKENAEHSHSTVDSGQAPTGHRRMATREPQQWQEGGQHHGDHNDRSFPWRRELCLPSCPAVQSMITEDARLKTR